ncbi:MAG TPA: peptide chain release factor N(5)-glutamine methyltransferase [Candidatus Binatia bacterium]
MASQAIEATEAPARRVAEVLRQGARRLLAAGIENGRLDAEVLLGYVLGNSREQLLLAANAPISHGQNDAYDRILARRLEREPVAYITGTREFWSLDFYVTRAVLIPRPESERLVEVALALASDLDAGKTIRIADLGTGSGAIAVALAKELPAAEIFAVDLSADALAVARRNAARHGVANRIKFVRGDLFEAIGARAALHLIVSNPPYIPSAEIAGLEPEVSRWEPRAALAGGPDGLDCYRRIAAHASKCLMRHGSVALEFGAGMGTAVTGLFESAAVWNHVRTYKDYAGNDRVVAARG